MTLEDRISKRISYLRIQIIHEGRLDGWSLEGHKKELKHLEQLLESITKQPRITIDIEKRTNSKK